MSAPSEKSVIFCTECGALNGVPHGSDLTQGKCGSCKAPLSTAKPRKIDDAQFDRLRARDTGAYIIDLWAPWCGPCRMMAPHFDAASKTFASDVRFFKLNTEIHRLAPGKLGIRGIPTLLAMKDGRQVELMAGALQGNAMTDWVASRFDVTPHAS